MLCLTGAPTLILFWVKDVCAASISVQQDFSPCEFLICKPTFRSHVWVGIKILEQEHFVWSLVSEVIPSLSWVPKHVCCLSGVASGDMITSDQICIVNGASVAERQRTVFDWVTERTPDNVEISVTQSEIIGVSHLLNHPDSAT